MLLQTHQLKPGDRVRLMDYGHMPLHYRRHVMAMGLMRGAEVLVLPKSPLGCPWRVLTQGVVLSFWPDEFLDATWETIECA